uniref:CNH domain-containing protein n=1 Tax=Sphenodon punctatus TaxID=8508 RepID=A0A8D0GDB0_SPHPU
MGSNRRGCSLTLRPLPAARNTQTGCHYLCGALEAGVVLLQWYEPMQKFMLVKHFDFPLPSPLPVFEMLVSPGEEYPLVCIGVSKGPAPVQAVHFQTINLNSLTSWFTDSGTAVSCPGPTQVIQLDGETVLVLIDRSLKLVNLQGLLLRRHFPAPTVPFDMAVESVALVQNCVPASWRHGVQVRPLGSAQVVEELRDTHWTFRLLRSPSTVIIETRPTEEPSGASNLYVLE